MRKAGLCADHFDERSFTNGTRKALRRNVVPRHYTEDFKYRRANGENQENRRDDGLETLRAKDMEGTMSFEGTSSLPGFCEGLEEVTCDTNSGKKISRGSEEDNEALRLEKTKEKSRSSSPLVEFIVEELDEALILQESRLLVNSSAEEATENKDEAGESEKEGEEEEEDGDDNESENGATDRETSDSMMSFAASDAEEISRLSETSAHVNGPRKVEKAENPTGLDRRAEELELKKELAIPQKRTCCPYNDSCSNLAHGKTLRCLRKENEHLRKKIKLLKRNVGRSRGSEMNFTKSATLKSIDDFLDIQECANPATRALIKLSLHKPKSPFTKEEKKLGIQLYRNFSETFVNLRRTGCNFPSKKTIKRWITEESYGDMVDDVAPTNEVDEVDDFHAPEAALVNNNGDNCPSHSNGTSQDSLTFDQMETEIHYMPETIDGVEQVLEAPPKGESVNVGHETFS